MELPALQERIEGYLSTRLPGATDLRVFDLRRVPGGASRETWSFDARWREDGKDVQRGLILRRDPEASLLQTERDIEFRVMDAVWGQGVPVPKMYWLQADGAWLERPFFVMERLDGCETRPQQVLMDPRFVQSRAKIAERFVDVLTRIHSLDWRRLGLQFLGVPKSGQRCAEMEIERWEAVVERDSLGPQPVLRAAFRWLRNHLPPPAQRITLVHADYRTGNLLCTPEGEIKGVLDWEMAHLGDPLEDVAWACIRPWRWLGDEQVGGLMKREEFYRRYAELSGLAIDEEAVRFWEVLGNVKLAVIFLTGARAFYQGRSRSPMMALLGRNIGRLELEIMDLMGV